MKCNGWNIDFTLETPHMELQNLSSFTHVYYKPKAVIKTDGLYLDSSFSWPFIIPQGNILMIAHELRIFFFNLSVFDENIIKEYVNPVTNHQYIWFKTKDLKSITENFIEKHNIGIIPLLHNIKITSGNSIYDK